MEEIGVIFEISSQKSENHIGVMWLSDVRRGVIGKKRCTTAV